MEREIVTERLDQLRQTVTQAKGVPMSASAVVNRAELLELIDQIHAALPEELESARGILAQGQQHAEEILEQARTRAAELTSEHEIVTRARAEADRIRTETEEECQALKRETDVFIDSRMASFESVLHKTTSQVATARQRLSERSGLDER